MIKFTLTLSHMVRSQCLHHIGIGPIRTYTVQCSERRLHPASIDVHESMLDNGHFHACCKFFRHQYRAELRPIHIIICWYRLMERAGVVICNFSFFFAFSGAARLPFHPISRVRGQVLLSGQSERPEMALIGKLITNLHSIV